MRMRSTVLASATLTLLALAAIASHPVRADIPGKHPAYLHALSDLRAARWQLHHPEEWNVEVEEHRAHDEIEAAINDIKAAGIDDGKNLDDHPPTDAANLDRGGRLHKALDYLDAAHRDVDEEEDNQAVHELRHKSERHIDHARSDVHRAINRKHHDQGT